MVLLVEVVVDAVVVFPIKGSVVVKLLVTGLGVVVVTVVSGRVVCSVDC